MASSSSWDMSGEPPSLSSLLELANNVGARGEFREIMRHEFSAVTDHSEAFVYFCENEARFVRSLPPEIVSARRIFTTFIKAAPAPGEVRAGSPDLLADMLSGAVCGRADLASRGAAEKAEHAS